MKRILIFSTAYLPFIGGAEIAVKELTDRISEYDFDLITARLNRRLPRREKVGRVNVFRVGLGNKFDKFLLPLWGLWLALRLNRSKQYEIIFSLMASQASIAAAFFKTAYPNKILVLNLQEGDEEEHLKRYVFGSNFLYNYLIKPWHLLVFKKADLITTISDYLKKRAIANGVKCPVEIVPNGVEAEKFLLKPPTRQLAEKLRKKLNFEESDVVLITTSRLVKKNAVEDIIKSLSQLPANVKLLILGDGPDRKMLEALAEELMLTDRVFFLGQVSQDDLPKYLAISDIFVRPSLSEGQGISFLEAMAAGVPIIATPVGGIVDFLSDSETGLFCRVKKPESIAEKVKIYLADKNLTLKITSRAKNLVAECYNWDSIALKMENILKKIKK